MEDVNDKIKLLEDSIAKSNSVGSVSQNLNGLISSYLKYSKNEKNFEEYDKILRLLDQSNFLGRKTEDEVKDAAKDLISTIRNSNFTQKQEPIIQEKIIEKEKFVTKQVTKQSYKNCNLMITWKNKYEDSVEFDMNIHNTVMEELHKVFGLQSSELKIKYIVNSDNNNAAYSVFQVEASKNFNLPVDVSSMQLDNIFGFKVQNIQCLDDDTYSFILSSMKSTLNQKADNVLLEVGDKKIKALDAIEYLSQKEFINEDNNEEQKPITIEDLKTQDKEFDFVFKEDEIGYVDPDENDRCSSNFVQVFRESSNLIKKTCVKLEDFKTKFIKKEDKPETVDNVKDAITFIVKKQKKVIQRYVDMNRYLKFMITSINRIEKDIENFKPAEKVAILESALRILKTIQDLQIKINKCNNEQNWNIETDSLDCGPEIIYKYNEYVDEYNESLEQYKTLFSDIGKIKSEKEGITAKVTDTIKYYVDKTVDYITEKIGSLLTSIQNAFSSIANFIKANSKLFILLSIIAGIALSLYLYGGVAILSTTVIGIKNTLVYYLPFLKTIWGFIKQSWQTIRLVITIACEASKQWFLLNFILSWFFGKVLDFGFRLFKTLVRKVFKLCLMLVKFMGFKFIDTVIEKFNYLLHLLSLDDKFAEATDYVAKQEQKYKVDEEPGLTSTKEFQQTMTDLKTILKEKKQVIDKMGIEGKKAYDEFREKAKQRTKQDEEKMLELYTQMADNIAQEATKKLQGARQGNTSAQVLSYVVDFFISLVSVENAVFIVKSLVTWMLKWAIFIFKRALFGSVVNTLCSLKLPIFGAIGWTSGETIQGNFLSAKLDQAFELTKIKQEKYSSFITEILYKTTNAFGTMTKAHFGVAFWGIKSVGKLSYAFLTGNFINTLLEINEEAVLASLRAALHFFFPTLTLAGTYTINIISGMNYIVFGNGEMFNEATQAVVTSQPVQQMTQEIVNQVINQAADPGIVESIFSYVPFIGG